MKARLGIFALTLALAGLREAQAVKWELQAGKPAYSNLDTTGPPRVYEAQLALWQKSPVAAITLWGPMSLPMPNRCALRRLSTAGNWVSLPGTTTINSCFFARVAPGPLGSLLLAYADLASGCKSGATVRRLGASSSALVGTPCIKGGEFRSLAASDSGNPALALYTNRADSSAAFGMGWWNATAKAWATVADLLPTWHIELLRRDAFAVLPAGSGWPESVVALAYGYLRKTGGKPAPALYALVYEPSTRKVWTQKLLLDAAGKGAYPYPGGLTMARWGASLYVATKYQGESIIRVHKLSKVAKNNAFATQKLPTISVPAGSPDSVSLAVGQYERVYVAFSDGGYKSVSVARKTASGSTWQFLGPRPAVSGAQSLMFPNIAVAADSTAPYLGANSAEYASLPEKNKYTVWRAV